MRCANFFPASFGVASRASVITIIIHFSIASGIQKRKRQKMRMNCDNGIFFNLNLYWNQKQSSKSTSKTKTDATAYHTFIHEIHGHWVVLFSRLSRCNDSTTCWTEPIRYPPKTTIPIDFFPFVMKRVKSSKSYSHSARINGETWLEMKFSRLRIALECAILLRLVLDFNRYIYNIISRMAIFRRNEHWRIEDIGSAESAV